MDAFEEVSHSRGRGKMPERGSGLSTLLIGGVMAVVGAYLLLQRVTIMSHPWRLFGAYDAFGLSLVPLLAGIGLLFFGGRALLAWALIIAGSAIIFAGIILSMDLWFRPTTLFDTLIMLVLLFGGVGLVGRALR